MQPDLLNYLPISVITIKRDLTISAANMAAEAFLGEGLAILQKNKLTNFIVPEKNILTLIENAFNVKSHIREYDFHIKTQRANEYTVNLQILPIETSEEIMIVIDDLRMASKLTEYVFKRDSTRSASSMASILAHEVKNPLSGIRGAAQLLQKTVSDEDRTLTKLICDEVDRIRNLMEEMEIFSNETELQAEPVNIHEVLNHVQLLAETGFASHVKFKAIYDPSLPYVLGNKNMLIQLFLNLVKNSSEALTNNSGSVIILTTSYHSGFRFKAGHNETSRSLPIIVTIEDNGIGIPNAIRSNIFDPFVTTKSGGKGLGLAIVTKIIADHGGAIELDEFAKQGTKFRVLLPAV